ncbi:MAG: hypothetical protein BWK72_20275 [Rhodoferax ferrireducens]|uniref:DUF932 domain-containing protein n=1 Tax=Rhodoferax ferrireducens TaxID=192843 RepID=A0A1W9KP09_9BURK|nr:MAG: hypothetical protein BWK72_20275 [Rhodoferax ferrireducens]
MARLNKLEDVNFPVKEHPVYVIMGNGDLEKRLLVKDKKALVNDRNQRVLGIVSQSYRVVSNAEAIDMAYQCCRAVFPETKDVEWEVNHVDAPSTAGYCHIDMVHKLSALEFRDVPPDQKPDIFGPFIRVTNSFNGLRALGFDIGFYRKVCKNGLILPETVIRFKFSHSRQEIGETLKFHVERSRLDQLKNTFTESVAQLRACPVERSQFEPLVCTVLQLRPPKSVVVDDVLGDDIADTEMAIDPAWAALQKHLGDLNGRYANELGDNAYAAFNAVTEFASRPLINRCVHRDRHGMQRLAGAWLAGFNSACRQPGFSIGKHLQQMTKS